MNFVVCESYVNKAVIIFKKSSSEWLRESLKNPENQAQRLPVENNAEITPPDGSRLSPSTAPLGTGTQTLLWTATRTCAPVIPESHITPPGYATS